ncbi:MAG: PAS domain S-box protein, partial [Gemmatimonadota bacterium]|nr:PAS domain S-box protein [Gemmatimonadota bacterium]
MPAKRKSAKRPVGVDREDRTLDSHRLIFETSPQGIIIAGPEGQMLEANPAALRILGLSLEQLQGMTNFDPHWRTVHEDGSPFPPEEHPMTRALRSGQAVGPEVMGVRYGAGDDTRWLEVSARPLFRPGETRAAHVMATFADITERKEIELRLRASQGLLERAEVVAQLGHFQVDMAAGQVQASEGAARIYGLAGNA